MAYTIVSRVNMASVGFNIACLGVLLLVTIVTSKACDDIDTTACEIMAKSRPDLCKDPSLSQTACPRFCKLCPLECYHCNASVKDYHECNTTTLCDEGQVCMRKTLSSYVDGHHEYQMTCELIERCDALGSVFPFGGKRAIGARDISVTCCAEDLCNYPESTTTTSTTTTTMTTRPTTVPWYTTVSPHGCKRDIIFMVDESTSMKRSHSTYIRFLHDIVAKLQIGPLASQVAMTTFAANVTHHWDLNRYSNLQDLQAAISRMDFAGGNGVNVAPLQDLARHTYTGDRSSASNVIIMITDEHTHETLQTQVLENQVKHKADDVIVIGVGLTTTTDVVHIATDTNHAFHMASPFLLHRIESTIASIICPQQTSGINIIG